MVRIHKIQFLPLTGVDLHINIFINEPIFVTIPWKENKIKICTITKIYIFFVTFIAGSGEIDIDNNNVGPGYPDDNRPPSSLVALEGRDEITIE